MMETHPVDAGQRETRRRRTLSDASFAVRRTFTLPCTLLERAGKLMQRYVGIVFLCMLSAGSFHAQGWDLAEDWKSGELWNIKRAERIKKDVFSIKVDEKTTQLQSRGELSFGTMTANEVLFVWKEDPSAPESESRPGNVKKSTEDKGKEGAEEEEEEDESSAKKWKLQRVSLDLYNRGDNEDMTEKEYAAAMADYGNQLDAITGVKRTKVRQAGGNADTKTSVLQWKTEQGVIRLMSAVSSNVTIVKRSPGDEGEKKKKKIRKRIEYIRLLAAANQADLELGGSDDKVAKKELKAAVVREEDGTVWIKGIPMVDQGSKGYCVPATVARVFAFYGMEQADMHTIAAVAHSDPDGGTSILEMEKAVTDIGRHYHVKAQRLDIPAVNFSKGIKKYNALAKKKELPSVEPVPEEDDWMDDVDAETWLEAFGSKKSDVSRWLASIRSYIDSGIPILWSVRPCELFSGRKGRNGGAHMRLIIGCNEKKDTVIYSDSWGDGPAARREMRADQACSITTAAFYIKP